MILWILYFTIDGHHNIERHPYHFAEKANCVKVGKQITPLMKYDSFSCVKDEYPDEGKKKK